MALKPGRVLISQEDIRETVRRLAAEMRRDLEGRRPPFDRLRPPLLIGVLKGSFIFLADLAREMDMPVEVEFVRLASYGAGTVSTGRVRVMGGLKADVRGRDVVVVEDIVDTGLTLSRLLEMLRRRRPASLRVCALIDKPSRRQVELKVDYAGREIPDEFVVGYGLDYAEQYRYLPAVYALAEEA